MEGEEEKGGWLQREKARVRQMSAAVLNAGTVTSTVAWSQAHPTPSTLADSERPAS